MQSHPNNFCNIHGEDWLDVMLTTKCNGTCNWCVEKNGYKPTNTLSVGDLIDRVRSTKKNNILLLGGEPTLYPELGILIKELKSLELKVTLTTNGSKLNIDSNILNHLSNLTSLNISIHHFDFTRNAHITRIMLDQYNLRKFIEKLVSVNVNIRLNCNLIKGEIDDKENIEQYIKFGKMMGVHSIRFAELKSVKDEFVDLTKIYPNNLYGINGDPFQYGCNHSGVINEMPISFKQMCGLQNDLRPIPTNPEQQRRQVLYCDDVISDGWLSSNTTVIKDFIKKGTNNYKPTLIEQKLIVENQRLKNEIARLEGMGMRSQYGCGY